MIEILNKLNNKIKIKWNNIKKYKDKSYCYTIVQIADFDNDLYIKMSGNYRKWVLFFKINNYKLYTALDIIMQLDKIGFNTRHSYDAVLNFFHDKDLDLGFVKPILRNVNYAI